ncbi:MAG: lactonase family protein [Lachnospiraceae bacterium]|nr:lactonase family protein [Lachnospiraceae bacterium]
MVYHVYVGSYMGQKGGDGIYLMELDTERGSLELVRSYPEMSSQPSYLTVTRNAVYAVSELEEGGYITAFRRNPYSGELSEINKVKTEGDAMCHLCLWPGGHYISAANYKSGSFLVCSVKEDGSLGKICDWKQHQGSGTDKERQEGPHVHSTLVSRDGKRLYAADLGLDRIFCYSIREDGALENCSEDMQIQLPGGMGPRHFVFSADGRFLYLMTEMGSRLFVYESKDGGMTFREIQNLDALPKNYEGFHAGADIHFSADGKFLYLSDRGVNDIVAYRVFGETGLAELVGNYSCYGDFPRNFCITPDDGFMLITNQKSGNVVLCVRDRETGAVGKKLAEAEVPQAVFVTVAARG